MSVIKKLSEVGLAALGKFLGKKVFEHIEQKSIPIPESVIRFSLSKMLSKHEIEIASLKCSEDKIHIQAKTRKMGVKVKYNLEVMVEQLQINPLEHNAVIAIASDSLHGENIGGSIASWLVRLLIDDIVAKSIAYTDSDDLISYDKSTRKATADLIAIRQVAMLYEPMAILRGQSIIQFFEVKSVSHTNSGLALHYDLKTDMLSGITAGVVKKLLGVKSVNIF